jgi:outer membrane protein
MKYKMHNLAALLLVILLAGISTHNFFYESKIAYVNSNKLMVGFSEAAKAEREIKSEDEKWQGQLKILQDSLKATMDMMTKEFDAASPAKKKEFQDLLSARNQQVNNFRQANMRRMEELKNEKMKSVIDKINVYIAEYGKKHRYSIILGTTAGGNILYADERHYDITDDITKGLNERYK